MSITTLNLRGGATSSSLPDNKFRQLLGTKRKHWHPDAIILTQEARACDRSLGVDPSAFGAQTYVSACGGICIILGSNWTIKRACPAKLVVPRAYYDETRVSHGLLGKWAIFNVHLPSPTHAHKDTCEQILEELLPKIRASIQRNDGVIVAGDFNEVMAPEETQGTFHDPLIIRPLLNLGLSDISPPGHTYFGAGGHSARLDRILAALPLTAVSSQADLSFLVDSDHKALTATVKYTLTNHPSIPEKDKRAYPARWVCTGALDRRHGIICLDRMVEGARPSKCPLGHNCKFELDTVALGMSETAAHSLVSEAGARIMSGVAGCIAGIQWEATHTWDDGIKALCHGLAQWVERRTMGPHSQRIEQANATITALHYKILQLMNDPSLSTTPSLQDELKQAREDLRREVRYTRRAKIKTALVERAQQLISDVSTWFKRIKVRSTQLRTDAYWDKDTLVFSPRKVRQHFAEQVQAAGSQVPAPSYHPYAHHVPPIPKKAQMALGIEFTEQEVQRAVHKLRASGAPGPSGISPRILRHVPTAVVTRWCNTALRTGRIGERVSKAYVRLLNKTDVAFPPPGKFRPITLLEAGYKVVSGLIQHRINDALRQHKGFPSNTYAFGPRSDISSPILLRAALLDHAKCTGCPLIIIDFDASAAFNAPPHDVIMQAWEAVGIPPKLLHLMNAMLTRVTFKVITDVGLTPSRAVQRGAVQGDVLAPLHWLMTYASLQGMWAEQISDAGIQHTADKTSIRIAVYADDTAAYLEKLEHIEWIANMIAKSLRDIGVQVNPEKTVIQVINARAQIDHVTIMGKTVPIKTNSLERYLGVFRNPGSLSATVTQAHEQIANFRKQYRTGALEIREAARLVQAVLVPQLTYRLALTPVGVKDILHIEAIVHKLVRHARGFPVGITKHKLATHLPSLVHAVLTRRLEGIVRCLQPGFQKEIQAPLQDALVSALPRRTQRGLSLWMALKHPKLARAIVKEDTLLDATTEALVHLNVYLGRLEEPCITLSDLLPGPLGRNCAGEAASIFARPGLLDVSEWSDDGLYVNEGMHDRFPLITKAISKTHGTRLALLRPFALEATAGHHVVQVYDTTPWDAYYYEVHKVRSNRLEVHYMHNPEAGDKYEVVKTRLPAEVKPWIQYPGRDPRSPIGYVEKAAVRPIAMRSQGTAWTPVLNTEELAAAYEPNILHGILDPDKPRTQSKDSRRSSHDQNVIYTDGSGQHDGVGWGVSGHYGGQHIRLEGGWVDPQHTAQEGELIAMLHALELASRSTRPTTIYSDSQHIVQSLQRQTKGRFAPLLMRHALQLSKNELISIEHIRAHQRSTKSGPSNPEADLLAKRGAQQAYGPLTIQQLPASVCRLQDLVFHDAKTHGIITHALARRPPAPRRRRWIRYPSRMPLAFSLRLEATIRGFVPGLDRDTCNFCGVEGIALSHHMTCDRRRADSKAQLTKVWEGILRSSGMPPGFWRLSPHPPWPTTQVIPRHWREYTHTDGSRWYISDGTRKHEFMRPGPLAFWMTGEALALVATLWPDKEPAEVMQASTFPMVLPSPAIVHLMDEPEEATTIFQAQVPRPGDGEAGVPVHHTWHWAFRRLCLDLPKVTSNPIEESTIDRIYITKPTSDLNFLTEPAQPFPTWEEAVEAGSEETTILGYIGPHSNVFPVGAMDILQMRDALRNPKARPSQAK